MEKNNRRLLIIEDDPIIANIYRSKFEKEGYEVEVSPDGQAGFYRLHESKYDALLLDLMLPQMNGLDILKKIRAQKRFEKFPVIVFTNAYLGNVAHEAAMAGATQVFFKATTTPKQIIDAINSILLLPVSGAVPATPPSAAMASVPTGFATGPQPFAPQQPQYGAPQAPAPQPTYQSPGYPSQPPAFFPTPGMAPQQPAPGFPPQPTASPFAPQAPFPAAGGFPPQSAFPPTPAPHQPSPFPGGPAPSLTSPPPGMGFPAAFPPSPFGQPPSGMPPATEPTTVAHPEAPVEKETKSGSVPPVESGLSFDSVLAKSLPPMSSASDKPSALDSAVPFKEVAPEERKWPSFPPLKSQSLPPVTPFDKPEGFGFSSPHLPPPSTSTPALTGSQSAFSRPSTTSGQPMETPKSTSNIKPESVGRTMTPSGQGAAASSPSSPFSSSGIDSAPSHDADATFQAEILRLFLDSAPESINNLRKMLQVLMKSDANETRLVQLSEMYRKAHQITGNAALAGLQALPQFCSAFEAFLKELYVTPANINASTLHTIAQVVDFLGNLVQKGVMADSQHSAPVNTLVVDDDIISRRAINFALEKANLKSVSMEDPVFAYKLLIDNNFDLIITDVDMPGMTGFELCTKLRALPNHKTTPVIFVTGLTDFESRARSVLSGGNDLIAKPFLLIELANKALMYIMRGRLANVSGTTAPVSPRENSP